MSATQLRKGAQENSKSSMSSADQVTFMELFHEQEMAMILKAIELHVSMPMVWAVLGRRVAICEANCWNRFLQTDKARKIFQTSGQGVKNKQVMKKLSAAYKQLTAEEKAALTKDLDDESDYKSDDDDDDADDNDDNAGNEDLEDSSLRPKRPLPSRRRRGDELTAAELAMDEVTDKDKDTPENAPPVKGAKISTGVIRGTVSNLARKNQVDLTMNRWAREAANLSATCCCEVVIFAVSKHLSNHCFRTDRCTPGAFKPNSEISQMDGNNQYSARLQALVTGNSVGQIAVGEKIPGASKKNLKQIRSELCTELAQFIARETNNIITSWPWASNETRLREAKFQLELAPEARSEIDWLRTDNKRVKKDDLSMLLLDLKNGHIILRRIMTPSVVPTSSASQANCPAQPSSSVINTQSSSGANGGNHDGDDD
ncbi:hypothetical protein PTTG_25188 [Puccinia triticina 1-1 BBBD Race 1]|uniref:Uncharacterized protein n=1 Tax=Puccinia triticina (isolate 1-1 / race 1 (BBBD)) TaxID=630390 RepID=A0A180H5U4_PUCT1|nr:hypothetical protein PTTG_25188 [Puccinia triticina 1-1 BBBD Race 1]